MQKKITDKDTKMAVCIKQTKYLLGSEKDEVASSGL